MSELLKVQGVSKSFPGVKALEDMHLDLRAGEDDVRFLDRHDFYDAAAAAYVIVRTGETRTYGNVILRKGVVDG